MTAPEKTHSGVLNRSKIESTGVEGLKSTGKSNDCEATLRKGSLPASSAVTTIDRDAHKGKAIECAENQNQANVLALRLSQEVATTEARKKVNKQDAAQNSDVGTHK